MKKLVSLILAIMMIAMVGAAWAADGDSLYHDGLNSNSKSVTIKKEITAYNPDGTVVNEPTATYTYTIAAGTADVSITDKDGNQAVTYAGVTTGITMTSSTDNTDGVDTNLTYGPTAGTLNTASTGTANFKDVVINFSAVAFQHPGIYRYTITETATTYNGSNGVVYAGTTSGTGAGTNVRYLDVYVKASSAFAALNPGTKDAYVAADWDIYGYALFTTDSTAIVEENRTNGNESTLYKTTGFVADSTQSTPVVADSYYTFNVTIGKTVVNDAYVMTRHDQFPFTVTFANGTVTQAVLPTETVGSHATGTTTALAAGNINLITDDTSVTGHTGALTPIIGHEGTVTYSGLPSGTSITVYETNNITNVIYAVTQTASTDGTFIGSNIATSQNSNNVQVSAQTAGTTNVDKTIGLTNTLVNISPTGIALRFAPYALILVAGIVLLIVAKKRKPAKDDEE